MEQMLLWVSIFLPPVAGILLGLARIRSRRVKLGFMTVVLAAELAVVAWLCTQPVFSVELWQLTDQITVAFRTDGVARLFALIAAGLWLPVGIYSFSYMRHEQSEDRFFAFFLIAEGALIGMDFSSNLVSMYVFFEMVTLSGVPLVLHNLRRESVAAALKYLFYSIAGAFMALLGILFLSNYTQTLTFAAGGTLDAARVAGHESLLRVVIFIAIVGLGAKAGMYPLHGWLPSAHPVAPAPASAVLSAVIAKSGVLGIVRLIYGVVGVEFLRGTWVQYAWLALALLTVFMGSMMAYREQVFKKRLAYSTVSQISYVLFGLFLLTAEGVLGGLLQVLFHAVIKTGLFLVAGSIIVATGKTRVDQLRGIGKQMPITLWCFTLLSLALVGIPPCSGFVSKWYLATASLASGTGVVTWLGPVILLISALLTAGYLLPITIHGFFPGHEFPLPAERTETTAVMWVPLVVLGALAVGLGIWSGGLVTQLASVAAAIV